MSSAAAGERTAHPQRSRCNYSRMAHSGAAAFERGGRRNGEVAEMDAAQAGQAQPDRSHSPGLRSPGSTTGPRSIIAKFHPLNPESRELVNSFAAKETGFLQIFRGAV